MNGTFPHFTGIHFVAPGEILSFRNRLFPESLFLSFILGAAAAALLIYCSVYIIHSASSSDWTMNMKKEIRSIGKKSSSLN